MDESDPPDWERLREVCDEITRLKAAGTWDEAAFVRLFGEATKACNGHGEYAECVIVEAAEYAWVHRVLKLGPPFPASLP